MGSFMMDLIVRTPRFPAPGETITGRSLVILPGGKGFNQAVASARSGARTAMVGCLGNDAFGQDFREWLDRESIDASGVAVTDLAGTGVGMPVVDDSGQNAIVIIPQANLANDARIMHKHESVIAGSDVIVLQLEIPDDANLAAARLAKRAGAKVVLNPAPFRVLPSELLELVDLLVPNEHELEQLAQSLEVPVDGVEGVAHAIHQLLRIDLVVTLGDAGALVVDDEGVGGIPGMHVDPVDTVGAGDTFTGNLAAHIARGIPLREAVVRANAAAALSVTQVGGAASTPTAEQVEQFLRDMEVKTC